MVTGIVLITIGAILLFICVAALFEENKNKKDYAAGFWLVFVLGSFLCYSGAKMIDKNIENGYNKSPKIEEELK